MKLSKKKRRLLSQSLEHFSVKDVANIFNVSEKELKAYIKSNLPDKNRRKTPANTKMVKSHTPSKNSLTSPKLPNIFKNDRVILILIAILILIVYANSLDNVFISDDIDGIVKNRSFSSLSGTFLNFPYIVQPLLKFVLYHIGGLQPFVFRSANIIGHILMSFGVFALVKKISGKQIGIIAVILFSIHPVLTESVAWISAIGYVFTGMFIVYALLLFIHYAQSKSLKTGVLSIALFVLALMTSPAAIVFPLLAGAYAISFKMLKSTWKIIVLYFSLSFAFGIYLLLAIQTRIDTLQTVYSFTTEIANPFSRMSLALVTYIKLAIVPVGLTFYHTEAIANPVQLILYIILTIAYLGITIYMWRRSKAVFFWLVFFPISLGIYLSPIKISSFITERYVYLASVGAVAIMATTIVRLSNMLSDEYKTHLTIGMTILIAFLFAMGTIQRNNDWQNETTFATATAQTSPNSIETMLNIGLQLDKEGKNEEALSKFEDIIKIKPNHAFAQLNLANQYQKLGNTEKAIEHYKISLSINPALWQAHFNMANIYFNKKDFEQAIDHLEQAVTINPREAQMFNNLGSLYLQTGQLDKAKKVFSQSLKLEPENQKVKELLKQL